MTPEFLKIGDGVALIAPAGKIAAEELHKAERLLRAWGLRPTIGQCACEAYGCFAGTAEQRLSDLQWALDDTEIKAIFCARGGYGLMQIVGNLDFTAFKSNPKWIVGYSDVTVLHNAASACGVASVHGPMLRNLAREELSAALLETYRQMLFGTLPTYRVAPHSLNRNGTVEGKIVGGNLAVFSALRGTPFDLDFCGKILFIEDIGERPHCIDRMIRNLKLSGALQSLVGLIVGQFSDYEEDRSMCRTVYEMIADAVEEYQFPVAFDFPSGHISENHPLIFNHDCRFSVGDDGVELDFSCSK